MRSARTQRGTALAETVLTVGLTLMLVFNTLQLALIGFGQMHADAAAYTVARIQAVTGDPTIAQNTAAATFPLTINQYNTTSPNGLSQSIATRITGGLLMLGNAASNVTLNGMYQEMISPPPSQTFTFAFAVPENQTQILNWFPQGIVGASGGGSAHSVYLAQVVDTKTNANGWNGPFAEWRDHQKCFAGINFPPQYSQTQDGVKSGSYYVLSTNAWINFPNNSNEASLAGWDASGSTSKC